MVVPKIIMVLFPVTTFSSMFMQVKGQFVAFLKRNLAISDAQRVAY